MIKVDVEELVRLKEQEISDKEISEYFRSKGIEICPATINKKLTKYYKEKGQQKPRARGYRISNKEEEIGEIVVKLRREGNTLKEIESHLKGMGKDVSFETVRQVLIFLGELEIKSRIKDSELVKLAEQGMSGTDISRYFADQGREISITSVNRRIRNYYESIGQEKPKKVSNEELIELKEQGLTDEEIVDYLEQNGRKISKSGVSKRLRNYYNSIGKERLKIKKRTQEMIEEQSANRIINERKDFIEQIRVTTPIQPVSYQDKSSENVKNYLREDEER